jgi:hypothetical protein
VQIVVADEPISGLPASQRSHVPTPRFGALCQ